MIILDGHHAGYVGHYEHTDYIYVYVIDKGSININSEDLFNSEHETTTSTF